VGALAGRDFVISRQWRGVAMTACSDAYIEHLRAETLPRLRDLRGFVALTIYRRTIDAGVEFLIETRWESLESIRAFSGDDVEAAVVPPQVKAMMVDHDTVVRNYTIVA
jgi:heme-degrading monooxygenase HmoA